MGMFHNSSLKTQIFSLFTKLWDFCTFDILLKVIGARGKTFSTARVRFKLNHPVLYHGVLCIQN